MSVEVLYIVRTVPIKDLDTLSYSSEWKGVYLYYVQHRCLVLLYTVACKNNQQKNQLSDGRVVIIESSVNQLL